MPRSRHVTVTAQKADPWESVLDMLDVTDVLGQAAIGGPEFRTDLLGHSQILSVIRCGQGKVGGKTERSVVQFPA